LKRYRDDKSPAEADTIESLRDLLHRHIQGNETPGRPLGP